MYVENKFLRSNVVVQWLIIVFSLVVLLCLVELLAFLFAFSIPYIGLSDNSRVFDTYKKKFHPIFTGKSMGLYVKNSFAKAGWQEYDPWFGYRNNRHFKEGNLATDKLGFISNGDKSRDISKKPSGIYRIFILGGSTVAGVGVDSPGKTISAHLERMLNASPFFGKKYTFQVINAGINGWYSPHEAALAQFELLYYKPDMIISFDGINDINAAETRSVEKKSSSGKYYWHSYQKENLKKELESRNITIKLFKNAWQRSKYNPVRYFYSLHLTLYKLPMLLKKLKRKHDISKKNEELHVKYPVLPSPLSSVWNSIIKVKDWANNKYLTLPPSLNTLFVEMFIQNLKNLHAICEVHKIRYMAVLQPILLPEFKDNFSDIEKFYYDFTRYFFAQNRRKNYRLSVLNYYKKCNKLAKKELGNTFFDFSKIFYNEKTDIYVAWGHYNEDGNKIIALKMKNKISGLLKKAR